MTKTYGQKELLSWNKKHFSLFLKGFQLSKIVSDLECAFKDEVDFLHADKRLFQHFGHQSFLQGWSGADLGLIWGCCKIKKKMIIELM